MSGDPFDTVIPLPAKEPPRTVGADWPEPIDILARPAMTGVSSIDEECVPATICRLALSEAERLGVEPVGIAASAIGVCSGVLTDDWRIRLKHHDRGWRESPRLWVCLLAESGSKKTEQIRTAMAPVVAMQARMRETHRIDMARWSEDHARWKASGKKAGDPEPLQPTGERVMCSDFTVESLSEMLAKPGTSKLLVAVDEIASFLGMFERYAGAAKVSSSRGQMLSAYEGGPTSIDRVQRGPTYVPNWSISLVGGIQPDRIRGLVSDLASDGLLQRMMMIDVPTVIQVGDDDDRPRDQASVDAYADLVTRLRALRPHALGNGLHPDIRAHDDDQPEIHRIRRAVFRLIERIEVDHTVPSGLRQAASKWRGTLARVAAVYHCVRVAEEMPEDRHRLLPETVAMAARFVTRVIIPSTFRFYMDGRDAEAGPMASARWIAEHILAHGHQRISRREIGYASVGLRGRNDEIMQAMQVLSACGWVDEPESTHLPVWKINPKVHQRFADLAAHHRERRTAIVQRLRAPIQAVKDRTEEEIG